MILDRETVWNVPLILNLISLLCWLTAQFLAKRSRDAMSGSALPWQLVLKFGSAEIRSNFLDSPMPQSRRCRRHSLGAVRTCRENTREKWLWSANPVRLATSASVILVSTNSAMARLRRWPSSQAMGD